MVRGRKKKIRIRVAAFVYLDNEGKGATKPLKGRTVTDP